MESSLEGVICSGLLAFCVPDRRLSYFNSNASVFDCKPEESLFNGNSRDSVVIFAIMADFDIFATLVGLLRT